MAAKQFVLCFLGASALLLLMVGVFNRVVDPFWYYRDIEIAGFNAIKTKFARFERDVKPALLMREQPEAIILGSSYSEIGFNPENPYFTKQGRFKPMNFAMAGAVWQRVQCELEFALKHAPLKRVLIGFQVGANMPLADCGKEFSEIGNISISELLFSSRALVASIQTIKGQKTEKPSHTRAGQYFYTRDKVGVDLRFKEDFLQKINISPQCLKIAEADFRPPLPLTTANLDLTGLAHVLKLAQHYQVELVLFAYPQHAYSLELEQQCGVLVTKWQVLKQIATLNEQQAQPATIWHFYDYNAITTEAIGSTAVYWQDSAHFNFEMGDVMLQDMFAPSEKPQLGYKVLSSTIEQDYQDFFKRRTGYLQQDKDFQTNLQKLSR